MDATSGTDMLGADIRTVEFHVAAVNPIFIGDPLQSPTSQIPGIGDQAKDPVQAHWSYVSRRYGGDKDSANREIEKLRRQKRLIRLSNQPHPLSPPLHNRDIYSLHEGEIVFLRGEAPSSYPG